MSRNQKTIKGNVGDIVKEIFINGKFLCQKITGVQRYAIEITKELDKLCTFDIKITIVAPSKEYVINDVKYNNISITYLKGKPNYYWEQWTLPRYCKKKKPDDLLNFCNIAPVLYPGSCTIHDLGFIEAPKGYNWKMKVIYKFITKCNIKRYKHIFTVSNTMAEHISSYYKVNKPIVTYNGYEHIMLINPIKPSFDLPNDFYLAVGSLNPNKNFKAIIELAQTYPNENFVIAGGKFKTFNNINVEHMKNLCFIGYVSDENLVWLYKHCKSFLFPSLYEGFGIPPLEAYAVGCRNIICNDIPVLKELYGDFLNFTNFSINTFLLPCTNFVGSFNSIKKYSWKDTTNLIFNMYKEVSI